MPFAESARAATQNLTEESHLRIVLDYLLNHGLGRANARPWSDIENHLTSRGIQMSQTQFQQGVLAYTRSGDIFIGSNDHSPRGYFLIQERGDFDTAREFYVRRIAAQQTNLDHLDSLLAQSNF
ncbi:MAG: hypothetical protein EAZ81_12975 [Verrucomicrobia bacterium]|nr:MAG: hypothetical protein EAZ81_12975 [Verrucomicrobiota bacterium]